MAIHHGLQVALILQKEICLICQLLKAQALSESETMKLAAWQKQLAEQVGDNKVHTFLTTKPLEILLTEMAEEYDALLLVAPKTCTRELLPKLPHSGFPFLFVTEKEQIEQCYRTIAVPISYMKKSKDLALWSSYFSRHNGASVSLVKAKARFAEDNRLITSILHSVERLFKNFAFPYTIVETAIPTWKIQKKALEEAKRFPYGLLIISFSHQSTFIDRLLGINDATIINSSETLSVMCINSQRDLYTFCG